MTPYTHRKQTLPAHLQESIDAYVQRGRPTGGFLRACIQNDLNRALALADDDNVSLLGVIVSYLYCECPRGCWGSKGAFSDWIQRKAEEREKETA